MRITNNSMVRNYTRQLNNNLGALSRYNNMITTQRRFSTMSEDTVSGIRAMQLRRSMDNVDSYKDIATTVKSQILAAEDQMRKVKELGDDVYVRFENALNGTNSKDEYKTFINDIENLRDQILATANGQFAGRFQFGGTNTDTPPFTVSEDKQTLYYNGVDVSLIKDADGNVRPEYQYLFDDASYVDIGLGLKGDENGDTVQTSAFKNSLNGLDFLGAGSDNLYLVCNELISAMQDPDFRSGKYGPLLDKIRTATDNVTLEVTELGADENYLSYTIDRLDNEHINLAERQNQVEFVDPAEAIMGFKMQEYVYNAALQMGQRLLQPTLFSFIN